MQPSKLPETVASATRAPSATPGGNNLNNIDESEVAKVAPKNPQETQLRDPATPPGTGIEQQDDAGNAPTPL